MTPLPPDLMRILIVSQMFPRRGSPLSGVFVLEQTKNLRAQGIDVSVLSPVARRPFSGTSREHESDTRQSHVDGVPVKFVPYAHVPLRLSTRFESWSLVKRLLPAVRAEHEHRRVDVLHAHQLFPTGYATVVIGRLLGIPIVCSAHGSDVHTNPSRNRGIGRYTRATLRMTDRTVAVSEDLARRIARLESQAAPTKVIYNGIDPGRFVNRAERTVLRRRLGLPERGVGICFVGRLVTEKGVHELIAAFEALRGTDEDVWLVVVGGGPLHDCLASRAREMHGKLVIAGPTPHSKVAEYLNAADLFALPSHGEGVPVAMLEAMACGLPVVATAVGGIPEVVKDGTTGFLLPPRDDAAFLEKLRLLVRDAPLRREMGRAARQRIDAGFHWSCGSEKLIDLYHELLQLNDTRPN